MGEAIFNVFLPIEDGVCRFAFYVVHHTDLADDLAVAFLQGRLDEDLAQAKRVELARPFTLAEYYAHCRLGTALCLYDEVFRDGGAGREPLFVTTLLDNGKPRADFASEHGEPGFYMRPEVIGEGGMTDWLTHYQQGDKLDLPRLIHDDYFLAIKLTFNARHYVSASKLLVSCIDSLGYIEFGDGPGPPTFVRWLNAYADLSEIGVTADELWEFRNGLLHMTNLSSRKVAANKVRRISVRVGGISGQEEGTIVYFELYGLIQAFAQALGQWLETYNLDRSKFAKFVERYDETISDSRMMTRARPHGDDQAGETSV